MQRAVSIILYYIIIIVFEYDLIPLHRKGFVKKRVTNPKAIEINAYTII